MCRSTSKPKLILLKSQGLVAAIFAMVIATLCVACAIAYCLRGSSKGVPSCLAAMYGRDKPGPITAPPLRMNLATAEGKAGSEESDVCDGMMRGRTERKCRGRAVRESTAGGRYLGLFGTGGANGGGWRLAVGCIGGMVWCCTRVGWDDDKDDKSVERRPSG